MGRLTMEALDLFRVESEPVAIDWSLFKFPKGQIRALAKVEKARTAQAQLDACYAAVDKRDGLIDRVTGKRVVPGSPDPKLTRTRHHLDERSTAPHKKYDPSNVIVCSAQTHQFLQSHALEVEGTDANQRLFFRWNRNMVKPGREPFKIASKNRSAQPKSRRTA